MLRFYDVNVDYANYLRRFDTRIPNITYTTHNKFVCGIVLQIGSYAYFAPISSNTTKQQTNLIIKDKDGTALSSIKFSFMFPALPHLVEVKDFHAIRRVDPTYADLLEKELEFCRNHEADIIKKAQKVYSIGSNPSHVLHGHCCNFPLLEAKLAEWAERHSAEQLP